MHGFFVALMPNMLLSRNAQPCKHDGWASGAAMQEPESVFNPGGATAEKSTCDV